MFILYFTNKEWYMQEEMYILVCPLWHIRDLFEVFTEQHLSVQSIVPAP